MCLNLDKSIMMGRWRTIMYMYHETDNIRKNFDTLMVFGCDCSMPLKGASPLQTQQLPASGQTATAGTGHWASRGNWPNQQYCVQDAQELRGGSAAHSFPCAITSSKALSSTMDTLSRHKSFLLASAVLLLVSIFSPQTDHPAEDIVPVESHIKPEAIVRCFFSSQDLSYLYRTLHHDGLLTISIQFSATYYSNHISFNGSYYRWTVERRFQGVKRGRGHDSG